MAVTLTIEDGTNVEGANSYMTVEALRVFATNRGVTLSSDDNVVAAQAINAMDYLRTYDLKWAGIPTFEDQALPFPRDQILLPTTGQYLDANEIPQALMAAQGHLVIAQQQGITLLPNADIGLPVVKEKIGPIETVYATPKDAGYPDNRVNLPIIDALLAPYLAQFTGARLRAVRI